MEVMDVGFGVAFYCTPTAFKDCSRVEGVISNEEPSCVPCSVNMPMDHRLHPSEF